MYRPPSSDRARRERFEGLAAEVYEPVQRYVRRRADRNQVDDIVSETMLTLWRRLDDVPTQAALPWAYGVARRAIANARRSNSRHLKLMQKVDGERRAAPTFDHSLDPDLHEALGKLSNTERELLRLWAWEELEPGEIAVAMGLTSNAVSIRLHRAKSHLAEILSESRKVGAPAGHSLSEESKEERL